MITWLVTVKYENILLFEPFSYIFSTDCHKIKRQALPISKSLNLSGGRKVIGKKINVVEVRQEMSTCEEKICLPGHMCGIVIGKVRLKCWLYILHKKIYKHKKGTVRVQYD